MISEKQRSRVRTTFAVAFGLALSSLAQTAAAQTVVDYYHRLRSQHPSQTSFQLLQSAGRWQARAKDTNVVRVVVDTANEYFLIDDAGTGGGNLVVEAAIFRMADRRPIILVALRAYEGEAAVGGTLEAYRLEGEKWQRLDSRELPEMRATSFQARLAHSAPRIGPNWPVVVHLPRRGTTVDAFLVPMNEMSCMSEGWFGADSAQAQRMCRPDFVTSPNHIALAFDRQSGSFSIVSRSDTAAPGYSGTTAPTPVAPPQPAPPAPQVAAPSATPQQSAPMMPPKPAGPAPQAAAAPTTPQPSTPATPPKPAPPAPQAVAPPASSAPAGIQPRELSIRLGGSDYTPAEGAWITDRNGCRIWNEAPQPENKVTISWSGQCINGLAQGSGKLQWFFNNRFGPKSEAEYRDGKLNGRGTVEYWGGRYFGEFRDNKRHGRGRAEYLKQTDVDSVYDGEWRDGRAHGQGTYTIGGRSYSGLWNNGCLEQGGQWIAVGVRLADCASGKPAAIQPSQQTAAAGSGQSLWIADKKTGCLLWNPYPRPNDSMSWSGACADGRAEGQGKLEWVRDGGLITYEGEFRDGRRYGHGIIVYADGRRYDGYWANNKAHGPGAFTFSNRTVSGVWNNGCLEQGRDRLTVGTTKEECSFAQTAAPPSSQSAVPSPNPTASAVPSPSVSSQQPATPASRDWAAEAEALSAQVDPSVGMSQAEQNAVSALKAKPSFATFMALARIRLDTAKNFAAAAIPTNDRAGFAMAALFATSATELVPGLVEGWLFLGSVWRELGRTEVQAVHEAETAFRTVLKYQSDSTPARFELASMAMERRDYRTALDHYWFLLDNMIPPPRPVVVQTAFACVTGHLIDRCIERFEALVGRLPDQAPPRLALASLLQARGRKTDAANALASVAGRSDRDGAYARSLAEEWKR